MRNVDAEGKRAQFALENILLLGKLYGKSSRAALIGNKGPQIPIDHLLAEKQRDD